MHETQFVKEIIFHVKDALARHGSVKSVLVKVSLSPFSHVSPEGLKGTFELFSEIEELKNIRLKIKPLVAKVHCKDCDNVFESPKITFHCPRCLSTNIDIKRDQEFTVESIEVNKEL